MATAPTSTPPHDLNILQFAWFLAGQWINVSLPSQAKQMRNLRAKLPR